MLQRDNVTWADMKPVAVRVVKGKSKHAKRTLPLTAGAAAALESCLNKSKSEWVFTGKGGKHHLSRHCPSEAFRVIRGAMNLGDDMVLHSTRHTFCTMLGRVRGRGIHDSKIGRTCVGVNVPLRNCDARVGALNEKKAAAPAGSDKVIHV